MVTLNKRFKTPVRKIFPRFIVCRRLRTHGRCRKLLRLCWLLHYWKERLQIRKVIKDRTLKAIEAIA